MKPFVVIAVFVHIFHVGTCTIINLMNTTPNQTAAIEYTTIPSNHIVIPVKIHLDKALTNRFPKMNTFERREKLKIFCQNILRNVERIFSHPSLNLSISFDLQGVKNLKNEINKIVVDENVSKYLKSYCHWQGEEKVKKQKWWYSILFTGLDVFYMNRFGKEVRSSIGRGYMRGMCSIRNSCTLLELHPRNIAYAMSHEIAHSLGISHDGPPHNECKDQRYIMNAAYSSHSPAKNWSPCNRRTLKQYLTSERAWCLRPGGINVII